MAEPNDTTQEEGPSDGATSTPNAVQETQQETEEPSQDVVQVVEPPKTQTGHS